MAKKSSMGMSWSPEKNRKKTSQGKTNSSISKKTMNKSKKRSYKKSRGQG